MKKYTIVGARKVERKLPKNLKENDIELFSHELEKEISETKALELANVYLIDGYVVDIKKLKFYNQFTHTYKVSILRNLVNLSKVFLSNLTRKTKKLDSSVFATDNWSDGYFHWLTDVLPRVLIAQRLSQKTELLISKNLNQLSFVSYSLNKLSQKYISYAQGEIYKIDRLIIPLHIAISGNYDNRLMNELREILTKNSGTTRTIKDNRKVYISREKATRRKIKNEDEVQYLLQQYNFEIHYFEEYSFEEQIQLMKETKVLVSLHGAGLTNMLFMPAKSKVLEIRNHQDSHNNCYFSLASDLCIDYFYLIAEGDNKDTHQVNVSVDIKKLKQVIMKMKTNE